MKQDETRRAGAKQHRQSVLHLFSAFLAFQALFLTPKGSFLCDAATASVSTKGPLFPILRSPFGLLLVWGFDVVQDLSWDLFQSLQRAQRQKSTEAGRRVHLVRSSFLVVSPARRRLHLKPPLESTLRDALYLQKNLSCMFESVATGSAPEVASARALFFFFTGFCSQFGGWDLFLYIDEHIYINRPPF